MLEGWPHGDERIDLSNLLHLLSEICERIGILPDE